MPVDPLFDLQVRTELAAAFDAAGTLVDLGSNVNDMKPLWEIAEGSEATTARLVTVGAGLLGHVEALGTGQLHLPLIQARALLLDAAACFRMIAKATLEPHEWVRFATIGTIARSCAEKSGTVIWVMDGEDRDARLRRSLIVEIAGVDSLLRYLPAARLSRESADLQELRTRLVAIAEAEFESVDCRPGKPARIEGEQLPPLTERVATPAHEDYAYSELSVHAHPTGFLHAAASETFAVEGFQATFLPKSTIHDEGRVSEAAVITFGHAVASVRRHTGTLGLEVRVWAETIAGLWSRWCATNGC